MLSKEDLLVMSYSRSKAGGGERGHTGDLGQKDGWGGRWAAGGLTLGISVISVGDTAEALLPCGVPDLGRKGQTLRSGGGGGRDCAGQRKPTHTRAGWGGETFPSLGSHRLLSI